MKLYPGLPPLSAVRAFEAAARHGSFSAAAEELCLTQAAVSYQIKQLEQRLGLVLFQRQPRKVVLTAAGERLAPAVLEAFRTLRVAFQQAFDRGEGCLAITALPTIAATWLVPRLEQFRLAHPHIAVRLETSVPTVDFTLGEFDVGLRAGLGSWPGLVAHPLLPSHFTPLCSPRTADRLRHPRDLLGLQRMGRERWWREWLAAAGVPDADLSAKPSIELHVEQFEVTSALTGESVAITSPLFFAKELAAGELVQPFEPVVQDERGYWVVYPAARRDDPVIRAFVAWVLDQARRTERPAARPHAARSPSPAET